MFELRRRRRGNDSTTEPDHPHSSAGNLFCFAGGEFEFRAAYGDSDPGGRLRKGEDGASALRIWEKGSGIWQPNDGLYFNFGTHGNHAGEKLTMTTRVTVNEVERVAELAHLEPSPEETPGMVGDLNAILDYVAELSELDTTGIAPLAQVSELEGSGGAAALRLDVIQPSLDRLVVMAEAPETEGAFFKVPKVIER